MRELLNILGWILVIVSIGAGIAGYGHTDKFADGTAQITWTGIALLVAMFGGAALMIGSQNPWMLFQLLFVMAGASLGIWAGQAIEVPEPGPARAAKLIGGIAGLIAAYLATLVLSRLIDWSRRAPNSSPDLRPAPKARGSDLRAREDRR